MIPAVRRELRAIDPALPVTQIATADSRIAERLSGRRFETQALSLFALIAVALSAAGLYASLAYQVAIRTREIGIRSAVGAGQRSIVTMILGQGLRRGLVGIAGAAGAGGVVQSLLYETAAIDVRVYATAILVLLLVIASAAALPAARAARVSPVTALRED